MLIPCASVTTLLIYLQKSVWARRKYVTVRIAPLPTRSSSPDQIQPAVQEAKDLIANPPNGTEPQSMKGKSLHSTYLSISQATGKHEQYTPHCSSEAHIRRNTLARRNASMQTSDIKLSWSFLFIVLSTWESKCHHEVRNHIIHEGQYLAQPLNTIPSQAKTNAQLTRHT